MRTRTWRGVHTWKMFVATPQQNDNDLPADRVAIVSAVPPVLFPATTATADATAPNTTPTTYSCKLARRHRPSYDTIVVDLAVGSTSNSLDGTFPAGLPQQRRSWRRQVPRFGTIRRWNGKAWHPGQAFHRVLHRHTYCTAHATPRRTEARAVCRFPLTNGICMYLHVFQMFLTSAARSLAHFQLLPDPSCSPTHLLFKVGIVRSRRPQPVAKVVRCTACALQPILSWRRFENQSSGWMD